jgi:hypothetical protein
MVMNTKNLVVGGAVVLLTLTHPATFGLALLAAVVVHLLIASLYNGGPHEPNGAAAASEPSLLTIVVNVHLTLPLAEPAAHDVGGDRLVVSAEDGL